MTFCYNVAIKIKISGNVQGVFFRAFVKERAIELGLKGYVKNMPDGSIEIIAQGKQEALEEFIKRCRKGPPLAKIENTEIKKVPDQEFATFSIVF